jgi:hypothetical protein
LHKLLPLVIAAFATTALTLTALAPPAGAAAGPQLPKPRSTTIKPNVGVGAIRLDTRMRPLPKGWKNPHSCKALEGISGCVWVTRRDALPPQGQSGISGPFVILMGRKRTAGFVISSGGKDVDAGPLRAWKTRKGVGFNSTLDEFIQAYPSAQLNETTGSYRIIAKGNITIFVFKDGVLNTIEMYTCAEFRDC